MFIIQDYFIAILFCFVTMLCWGSWGNTQKLAAKTGRTRRPRDSTSPTPVSGRLASPPFALALALDPSGLGHVATLTRRPKGPPGLGTQTVGAPGRGMLRVDEQLPVKLQMGSLQQPLRPGTMLRFGSLEFMSFDGSYDMILLPSPRDGDNGGRQPTHRRRNRRRLPHVAEEHIRVCPIASPADGGGGGATKAKQEAAPRRLSSESTAPAPQRGTRRASTDRKSTRLNSSHITRSRMPSSA